MSKIKSNTKMDNWIFNPLQLFSIIKKKNRRKKKPKQNKLKNKNKTKPEIKDTYVFRNCLVFHYSFLYYS